MSATLHTVGGDSAAAEASSGRWLRLVVGAAFAATLISLTGSWIPSLWGDEAASIMSATRSVPSLFTMLGSVDAVHGLYYFALHGWVSLAGTSPFAVRLPSAVAVGATVAAVMIIARRLDSTRVAVAAGIICAVIPRVTYMGSEARSYAFAAALTAWLMLLLVTIVERRTPSRRWWFAYGTLFAVGIYLFLYVVLVAVVHAVVLVSVRAERHLVARWALTVVAAVTAAAPLVILAVHQRGQIAFLGHRDEITFHRVAVSPWFGQPLFTIIAWTLIAIAMFMTVAAWWSQHSYTPHEAVRRPLLGVVAASWLFIPAGILIGGFAVVPAYTARYLSICAPAAALLIAMGLDALSRRRANVLAAGVLIVVAMAAPAWVAQRQPHAKNNSDFAETSSIIATHALPGDAVLFDEDVRPSRRPRLALHLYPEAFTGLKDVALDLPYDKAVSWYDTTFNLPDAVSLGRLNDVHRLWFIEYSNRNSTKGTERAELARLGYKTVQEYHSHRSTIYEYLK